MQNQDTLAPSVAPLSYADESILVCAVRYCIGRMSYIVGSCDGWLRSRWDRLSPGTRDTILRDIKEALERHRLGHGSIGMDVDERTWAALYHDLSPQTEPVNPGTAPNTDPHPNNTVSGAPGEAGRG